MKVIQVLRSSKKTTRVKLEDGFELCIDSIPGQDYIGMDISVPEFHVGKQIVRPLFEGEASPKFIEF